LYVSPNHPNPPRQAAAPEDTGQRLVTFPRNQGDELRVSLAEFNGFAFVSIRVWERDRSGAWWPTKKGASIRLRECGELAEVLARVAGRIEAGDRQADRRQEGPPPARRGSARPPFDANRATSPNRPDFDEC
jgi:Transcriptional Coactivator p15 (PC4)